MHTHSIQLRIHTNIDSDPSSSSVSDLTLTQLYERFGIQSEASTITGDSLSQIQERFGIGQRNRPLPNQTYMARPRPEIPTEMTASTEMSTQLLQKEIISQKQIRARRSSSFFKRKRSFIRKAHAFQALVKADVYVVLKYEGKFYTYSSATYHNDTWPPTQKFIVSLYHRHLVAY